MDRIAQWLEAGAPGVQPFTTEWDCAEPHQLFGPVFDVGGVAALTHLTPRCVRKYAAWTITYHCAQDREPLPLLLTPDGEPLRAPDGSTFAVVGAPRPWLSGEWAPRRGRPATTRGEQGWQFQQANTYHEFVELPPWMADEQEPEPGRILLGRAILEIPPP